VYIDQSGAAPLSAGSGGFAAGSAHGAGADGVRGTTGNAAASCEAPLIPFPVRRMRGRL